MRAALLLHGFATDSADFSRLAPFLCARYEKIYSPNLPKHGPEHKKSRIDACEIISFAEDAFDALKREHDVVDVFGFSMGGVLAAYLASIKDVNRLIALAPANKYLSPGFLFAQFGYKPGSPGGICTSEEIKKDNKEARRLFTKELLPRYTVLNISGFNKVLRHCNKAIKTINVPALILWGRFDQLVPEASMRHLVSHCRHSCTQAIIYSDISHLMLHSCAFSKIVDDILSFLDKTDAPSLTYKKA